MKHAQGGRLITPQMTVLDVLGRFRQTESVFRKYDARAGICICCQALFDPLERVARDYALDLDDLLQDLEQTVEPSEAAHRNP